MTDEEKKKINEIKDEKFRNFILKCIENKKDWTLEEECKHLTERQFMISHEYDTSWTVDEKLEFYRKHCKKD